MMSNTSGDPIIIPPHVSFVPLSLEDKRELAKSYLLSRGITQVKSILASTPYDKSESSA